MNSIGEDNVVVNGGPLATGIGEAGTGSMVVEFVNQLANKSLEMLEVIDDTLNDNDSAVEVSRYLTGDEPGMGLTALEIVHGGFQTVVLPFDADAPFVQQELERMATIAVPRGQITEATNATPVLVTSAGHGLTSNDVIFIEGASVDGERSRIVGGLSQVGTTVTVEDGSAFTNATPFRVRVDAEDMIVTNKVGDTLTVTRAANGTTPTVHVDGRRVMHIENTAINGRRQVTVINENMFSLHHVGGADLVGDGDYAGRGRWSKMGNVEVTGGPLPGAGMNIQFGGDLSHVDVGELNPDGSLLTGGTNPDAVITTLTQGEGITAGGDYIGGGRWIKNIKLGPDGSDLSVRGTNDIQEISFAQNNLPTGGTFTLAFKGMATNPIAFDATAADVGAALNDEANVSSIGAGNVLVTGGPLPQVAVRVEFIKVLKCLDQPEMVLDGSLLSGINSPAGAISTVQEGNGKQYTIGFDTNESQRIVLNGATDGTFALQFDATGAGALETSALVYNATAPQVQTALEGLATITSGDVIATGGPLPATPVDIEFAGQYSLTPMNPMVIENAPSGNPALVGTTGSVNVLTDGRRVTD
ncbi:MAG: hypothetical protein VB859_20385, partial [Planctomycetaceae bacterium]